MQCAQSEHARLPPLSLDLSLAVVVVVDDDDDDH